MVKNHIKSLIFDFSFDHVKVPQHTKGKRDDKEYKWDILCDFLTLWPLGGGWVKRRLPFIFRSNLWLLYCIVSNRRQWLSDCCCVGIHYAVFASKQKRLNVVIKLCYLESYLGKSFAFQVSEAAWPSDKTNIKIILVYLTCVHSMIFLLFCCGCYAHCYCCYFCGVWKSCYLDF